MPLHLRPMELSPLAREIVLFLYEREDEATHLAELEERFPAIDALLDALGELTDSAVVVSDISEIVEFGKMFIYFLPDREQAAWLLWGVDEVATLGRRSRLSALAC
jgi:hypothetical protein